MTIKLSYYGFFLQMIFLNVLLANGVNGQKNLSIREVFIDLQLKNTQIVEVFNSIESKTDYTFNYNNPELNLIAKVNFDRNNISVFDALMDISKQTGLKFRQVNKSINVDKKRGLFSNGVEILLVEVEISGKITDENEQGLPGASIVVKGTINGTTSDLDGNYKLSVSEEVTLVISFVGYVTQEILIAGRSIVDVSMVVDASQLEEVVVIGYGTQKKRDLTGSVSSLVQEDFYNNVNTSVDQMLQGRVAGLRVSQTSGQPGGGVSIRIRGNSSLNATNEPLYVIDGMPISNGDAFANNGSNIPSNSSPNPLNSLNPQDIQSIEVLKDASATAIYGARGANGVILITTKSGEQGSVKINYNTSFGLQKVARPLDLLSGEEYVEHVGALLEEQGSSLVPELSDPTVNTDWQDEIFETALTQQHNISVSGGDSENKFFTSFNYTGQDGVVRGSGFERFSGRFNWELNKGKLSANVNISTALTLDDITPHGRRNTFGNLDAGVISTVANMPPTLPVFNPDGTLYQPGVVDLENPISITDGIDVQGRTSRTMVNLKAGYEVLNNLNASVRVSTDISNAKRDSYRSTQTVIGAQAGGIANILTSQSTNYVIEALLNYNRSFEDHEVSALAGYTFQKFDDQFFSGGAQGFFGDEVGTDNLSAGNQEFNTVFSSRIANTLLSYLSRVNYSYNNKLLFTASFRIDGSSRFTDGNKYGFFPSFSLGYRLSEESFIESIGFINDLKGRIGWGQIGNEQIPGSATVATFIAGASAVYGNVPVVGLAPARIPNPDLTWETTEQLNVGLDFSLFDYRVNGSVDFYNKKTRDLLFRQPVPLQTGFGSWWVNLPNSEITNSGIEVSINTINTTGRLGWETALNLTLNKNEVTDLGGTNIIINQGDGGATAANFEGEAAFSYFGFERIGIWQTGEDASQSAQPGALPGHPKWKDQNEDGVIDADDRTILGNPYPELTWGINNVFKYSRFELSIFVEGVHGVDLFSTQLADTYSPFDQSRNRFAEPILNRWTVDNPTNEWPSFANPSSYGGDLTNPFTIQDASFIRLKNVTVTYNFNLENNKLFRTLSAYVSGQNLALFTDYLGFDPDVVQIGNARSDIYSYPVTTTILLGLNIGF